VWRGQVGVTGATRTSWRTGARQRLIQKNFITYIEIYEQTAHDSGLHAFAKGRGISPRGHHRGQVSPANDGANPLTYYQTHGQKAAEMVSAFITKKWNETVKANENTFVRNAKQTLTTQSEVQDNDFSYDVTMYYDNTDIYVVFHCYHAG
jgi:hypothetical protein